MSDPDKRFESVFDAIKFARKAITDKHGETRGFQGNIPCPCCDVGTLNYSRASNGHIHARCTTPKCVSWME